jgi:tetratricopeptide (TPR) repeat protein
MNKHYILLSILLAGAPLASNAQDLREEPVEDKSLQAFGDYWRSFDDYEDHKFLKNKGSHFEAWDRLKTEWRSQEKALTAAQLDDLKSAVKRYENQLKEHPTATSTPYARMNLAQVLSKIASLQDGEKSAEPYQKQALAVLADLNKNQPGFTLNDEALYLRATILESMNQDEAALNVWQALARDGKDSIYTVHANLAIGDSNFEKEKASKSLKAYQNAEAILARVRSPEADYEKLRVNYRLAWAAYRTADLEESLVAAQKLLHPESDFKRISMQKRMTADACDLIADTLFEQDKVERTKDYLQKDILRPYASTIGLRILSRLASNPTPTQSIELADFLLDRYPAAKEAPEIATILADVYRSTKQEGKYVATLERLSLMLPRTSVWRVQHKNDPSLLANMESKALNANQLLAGKFYENGMVQGSQSSFETARTYYDALLKFSPDAPEAETWELRRAHSLYFANHFDDADKAYESFKNRGTVSPENLEVAFYQQTLSREKVWRQSLAKFDETGTKPNAASMAKLRRLQDNITAFADRFPNRGHVVDLLLLAASANRDLNDFAVAEGFWNRALLSDPSPTQRTLAIRGLVQSKIKSGKPEETLALTRNYLKLENFDQLGSSFQGELVGIVSASVKETAAELNAKGKVEEAGQLLLAVTREFPAIPDHDALYRDGAYYMALAGNWKESEAAANTYLAEQKTKGNTEDLLYLKARALEYQLRFHKAATAHLALAEAYPKYSKALPAAQRAEGLAAAEDDYKLAGKAASIVSNYQGSPEGKTEALLRSADYYAKAKAWPEALQILARAETESRSPSFRLKAQLQVAKVWNAQGQSDKALASYRRLAADAESRKEDLDKSLYKGIVGESNFLLGEALQKEFERVEDEGGNSLGRLKFKGGKLEESLKLYNKAIAADDSEWSSRARFNAAQLAENMSQAIRTAMAKGSAKEDRSLDEQARRWVQVSQQYHTQNLMARQKDPYRYRDVVWIERSALKASGLQPQVEPASRNLPSALDTTQPYQWSH